MKRILALVLALCMVFALCACGNGDKRGKPHPKWMVVTEYAARDGEKVSGRTHHHAIVEGVLSRDEYEMLWRDRAGQKIGFVRCERIDVDHGSMEGLVQYMTKNRRHVRRWRGWSLSPAAGWS